MDKKTELTLRGLRMLNCNLTQKEIAKRLRLSDVGYSYIETRQNVGTIKTWLRIQSIYRLSDEQLVRLMKRQVRWKDKNNGIPRA